MRPRTIIIILCTLTLIVCAANAQAQRRRPARRAAATAAPGADNKPAWTISTERNAEDGQDSKLVRLEPMPLAVAPGAKTQAQLAATFKQEKRAAGQTAYVVLTFLARAAECQFANKEAIDPYNGTFKTDLKLLLDGRPLALTYQERRPQGEGVWWAAQETEGGGCAESVAAVITPQTLAKLTAARKVSASIGAKTFSLTDNNLNALRAFARNL